MLLRQQPAVRLALVDHALPDGPGTELLAFIKTRYRQVRVVALVSSPRAAMEYKLLGALAVAQKPVTPHQVAQLLAAAREEKRDTRRFPLRVPVMVNGTMAAFSLNVSADGMLLETPDPLTTAEVSLTMLPENTAPACRFRARVVRSGRHQSLAYAAVQLTENIGQTLLEHLQGRAATAV
jgi:DNA-binding NarL/FixJ family response regulator